MSSTVNLTLEDYSALQESKHAAENLAVKLKKECEEMRLTKGLDIDLTLLNANIRCCADIARFAVANLPPESIKGWPWKALRLFAYHFENLPDTNEDDKSFASELRVFASECEKHERRRAAMPVNVTIVEMNK